jgi:hypothetical protein
VMTHQQASAGLDVIVNVIEEVTAELSPTV